MATIKRFKIQFILVKEAIRPYTRKRWKDKTGWSYCTLANATQALAELNSAYELLGRTKTETWRIYDMINHEPLVL